MKRPWGSGLGTLATLVWIGVSVSAALAIERGADEDEREVVPVETHKFAPGFVTESELKKESVGKTYFFLNNEVAWPEKHLLPAPPKKVPVAPPQTPPAEVAEVEGVVTLETATGGAKPALKSPAAVVKSKDKDKDKAMVEDKKIKIQKKKAASLPDIEKLLADVRRSAKPRSAAPASEEAPVTSESPSPADLPAHVAEVEATVDLDDLARDLETFQKAQPASATSAPVKSAPESPYPWWMVAAISSVTAAGALATILILRRRRQQIRSPKAIDAETRAYFKKLYNEQKRKAVSSPPPPPMEVAVPEALSPTPAEEEQNVFLLPPELAEGAYKEAVMMAGMGEPPESIAQKLHLGEGEVRLVLDIARLSRGRMQEA